MNTDGLELIKRTIAVLDSKRRHQTLSPAPSDKASNQPTLRLIEATVLSLMGMANLSQQSGWLVCGQLQV